MKEYGGYFELENFRGNEYHRQAIRLNSARNSIVYLMRAKKINKLYIPYFLCNSVKNILIKHNLIFEEYHIDKNLRPILENKLKNNEYVLIVNYFDQLQDIEIQEFKGAYNNVIVDNTQSFFRKELQGIDSFNSCRKFFGVPDGSYLYTDSVLTENLERDKSYERMTHLLGRFEVDASSFHSFFSKNDAKISDIPLKKMSKLTKNLLSGIDYDFAFEQRMNNFNLFFHAFEKENVLNLTPGKFCYPLYIENGEYIRKKLIEKKIYVPILWPNIQYSEGASELEKSFAKNIVNLPCDHRYDENDVKFIIEEVKRCIN